MTKEGKILKGIILTILGIVIILNFLGLIVETLFTFGLVQTDVAAIRTLHPITTILSLVFIISAVFLWWNTHKEKPSAFWWWHIFIAISLIDVAYKWRAPTALAVFMPKYFTIMPIIILAIWAALFIYFKKLSKPVAN